MNPTETPGGAHAYAAAHQRKKRWRATVACLGVLVAACTVYALMTSASTLEGKTYCGLEEHAHTEVCYESVLSCGLDEAADEVADEATDETASEAKNEAADEAASEANEANRHTHTEACYKQVLVCELEEHAHIDECYINPDAENLEAAALPEGAQIPEGYTEVYTARNDDEGFAVSVYTPEGALPEEATLSAALISEDNEAYTQVEEELSESLGVDFSSEEESDEEGFGFVALDIHFSDAEGNEIEPTSEVYVVIDAGDLLPEGVDSDTLAVQHHAESDSEVNVETVADAGESTEGVVAATDETGVQAAFAVDGFSYFTITWTGYFTVTIYYVDSNGNLINGVETANFSFSSVLNSTTYTFSTFARDIDRYTYSEAHYNTSNTFSNSTSTLVTHMSFLLQNNNRRLIFYNGDSTVYTSTYSRNLSTLYVYLVYTEDSDEGSGSGSGGSVIESEDASVTTSKTAYVRDDGNYDLTLTISGNVGSETSKAPVDVLFIVDTSNSMTSQGTNRLDNAQTAMKTLVGTLENNSSIDVMYNIVSFNSSAYNNLYWSSVSGDNVETAIDNIGTATGTNYEAALVEGVSQLGSARSGATTVVIFLSDGTPTLSVNQTSTVSNGLCLGTGSSTHNNERGSCTNQYWLETLAQAEKVECDYFFAISIGSDATTYLTQLGNSVKFTSYVDDNDYPVYVANDDGSNLTTYFSNIASAITTFSYAEDVTVYDQLSEWADIVVGDDENPVFTITVTYTDNDGNEKTETNNGVGNTLSFLSENGTGANITLTVSYNTSTKTITLDFPDDYQLEEGYTYSVSTVITPSDAAKNADLNSEDANQTPDDGTGTYADAGGKGFLSNVRDSSKVTYSVNGVESTTYLSKPVIQLTKMDFTFYKIDSVTEEAVTGAEFLLYRSSDNCYYYEDPETGAVSWVENRNGATTLYGSGNIFTIKDLQVGTYYLEEVTVPNGYLYLSDPVTITISKNDNDIVVTQVFCGSTDLYEYIASDGRSFSVTNTTGQELPSAGGSGTTLITCTGIALVTIAGCGYGLRRIRERRGNLG